MLDGIVDGFLHDTIQVHRHRMIGNVDGMMTADLAGAVKQRPTLAANSCRAKTRP